MEGSAKVKVPGGKLVHIKIRYSKEIEDVKILGDFFIHPEGALAEIELSVEGIPSGSDAAAIAGRISEAAEKCGAEMIGVTPAAIAEAIRMALK